MMIEVVVLALAVGMANQVTETEVSFPGVGLELKGVLSVPDEKAKMPAVLLLPGSGPTDRDGNQPPQITTNILKDISVFLNEVGFVTLRFDKRPVHRYAEFWPKDIAKISEFFSVENHLSDVESAYKFLADQKTVDSKRIYILGHSEGGIFANALGAKLNPKGLILLGTPARTMDVIIREQLAANIAAIQDTALRARIQNDLDRAIASLKEKPEIPDGLHPGLASLFNPSTAHIWHGYFSIEPISKAKAYKGNVFVANGENDVQISAERDAKPLAEAFGDRGTLYIAPETSHNFKHVDKPSDLGFAGPVVPGLLENLKAWLKKQEG